ncbi:MAG: aminopeptidase P N-terminal domain-containing protein [Bacteroidales bacterium]
MIGTNIPAELFIKNRFKLISELESGSCAIIYSADEMPRNGDQYFTYRQNSDFFYLSGIEQEKSILMLAPGHKNPKLREVLVILKPTPEFEIWNGHRLTLAEAKELSGITKVIYLDAFESTLAEIIHSTSKIYLNQPELPKFFPEIESRDQRKGREIKEKYPYHEYKRLAPVLRKLRVKKENEEVNAIRHAASITRKAFQKVLSSVKPGMNEKELEAELWFEFIKNGAKGHAFPPIVASGKNACYLHYTDNNQDIRDGDLVLMDFGAEYQNYAADCSRTFPANGKFSDRQKDLYNGLLEVFKKAREIMRPGIRMEEVHNKVGEWMLDFHKSAGLYSQSDIDQHSGPSPIWFKYYMHGTGHSVGLDVHDAYDKTEPMEPGMIFTCEPGIYIMEEEIGIRLENDILITENGNIDLMEEIPIELIEIEELMRSR